MAKSNLSAENKDALAELMNLALGAAGNSISSMLKYNLKMITPAVTDALLVNIEDSFKGKAYTVKYRSGGYHRGGMLFVLAETLVDNIIKVLRKDSEYKTAEQKLNFLKSIFLHIKDNSNTMFGQFTEKDVAFDNGEFSYGEYSVLELGSEYAEGMAEVEMKFVVGNREYEEKFQIFVPVSFAESLNQNFIQKANVQVADFIPILANLSKEEKDRLFSVIMYCKKVGDFTRVADLKSFIKIRLAEKKLMLKDLWDLNPGSVIEFKKKTNTPADIVFGEKKIAKADVIVLGEQFGIKIKEVLR